MKNLVPTSEPVGVQPRLEDEAPRVLFELRGALWSVICAVPGGVRTSAELHKALRIDPMLAWGVHKVATSEEPFAASVVLPGKAALNKFLSASKKIGVPPDICSRATTAVEEFESMVERHAGDRATFESMAADLGGESAQATDLRNKRAAFRANGHIWGVQAKAMFSSSIFYPNNNHSAVDCASIRGQIGLRQLRTKVQLRTEFGWKVDADGKPAESGKREPIDPGGEVSGGIALMREFCSQPLPEFRVSQLADNWAAADLVCRGLGNSSAITCMIGSVSRQVAPNPHANSAGSPFEVHLSNQMIKPTEVFVRDLIVHENFLPGVIPTVRIFGNFRGMNSAMDRDTGDLLPIQAEVVDLGRVKNAGSGDIPRYSEMLKYTFDRLSWDIQRCRVFRCRIEYPVLHSVVSMDLDAPKQD